MRAASAASAASGASLGRRKGSAAARAAAEPPPPLFNGAFGRWGKNDYERGLSGQPQPLSFSPLTKSESNEILSLERAYPAKDEEREGKEGNVVR